MGEGGKLKKVFEVLRESMEAKAESKRFRESDQTGPTQSRSWLVWRGRLPRVALPPRNPRIRGQNGFAVRSGGSCGSLKLKGTQADAVG
jgi:hypothetical protein